jgi:hypothetical protein
VAQNPARFLLAANPQMPNARVAAGLIAKAK